MRWKSDLALAGRGDDIFRIELPPEVFPEDAVALIARDPWYFVTPPLGDQWNEATDLIPLTFKNFLVSLTLLRDLSKRPLAPAFPSSTLDNVIHVAGVQGGGKLVRTESPAADFPIYLLPTPPPITAGIGGMVVVKHAGPWAQVDAWSVQKSVDDGAARNGHASGPSS